MNREHAADAETVRKYRVIVSAENFAAQVREYCRELTDEKEKRRCLQVVSIIADFAANIGRLK